MSSYETVILKLLITLNSSFHLICQQWRQRVSNIDGDDLPLPFSPPLPSSPLPSPPLPTLTPPAPSPPLPLEVGPFNPARGSGGALLGSRVWGGAPAEIEFGAF